MSDATVSSTPLMRKRISIVWVLLMVATCITTWGLSKDGVAPLAAAVGIVVLAALKVRYVILDFMEIRNAPIPLRTILEAWPVIVGIGILAFYLSTTS